MTTNGESKVSFLLIGLRHPLHKPREDYRHWPPPSHRQDLEDYPAFTSRRWFGVCRRDRVGGGRRQEGVVRLEGLSTNLDARIHAHDSTGFSS